jgi:hypothetical protein
MNSMTTNPTHTNQGGHHDREGRSNQDDKSGSNPGKPPQKENSGEESRDDNRDEKNA